MGCWILKYVNAVWRFSMREAVLFISALCAILSMLAVKPDAEYLGYIDLRVICLLFCLMAVVLGFQSCNLFKVLAQTLLAGRRQMSTLILILVLLPFFCSMLVTNDVALITFVPFSVLVLKLAGKTKHLAWVVVLQTLAANLGSMATQVGNPQNLFLYAYYKLSAGEFFSVMIPITFASLLLLTAAAMGAKRKVVQVVFESRTELYKPKLLIMYLGLFLLCLLSVFRILHFGVLTGIVILCFLLFSRKLLLRVDYSLLLTFICFFIFSGNLGRIPAVWEFLTELLEKNALLTSALTSQVISNVPAAVLLSGFTDNWRALILGTDVGGLGTPIASLASLISLKLYLRTESARPIYYLWLFTAANIVGLLILLPLAAMLI